MVREERGVTLVEIIIALAIAAILASTVLFGRDQLRAKQQFSQGVDQIVQTLAAARQEAAGTVGKVNFDPVTGGGTSTNEYIYGKLVFLTSNSTTISIKTETIDKDDNPVNVNRNPYPVVIPWGVVPSPPNSKYFLFAIQPGGGISTYSSTVSTDVPTAGVGHSKYGTMTAVSGSTSFDVSSGSMTATITVDQSGNVSRVIN